MLQQTRVSTVVPYYERFLEELPTVTALAEAAPERVLTLWSGLGYYRRARMLHAAAKRVVREHGGRLPSEPEALMRLEGVGAYTAGAVASMAFGRRAPVVDGNVTRVFARLFAVDEDVKSAKGNARIWKLAGDVLAAADGAPGDWNQAVMELGATVCLPRDPRCGVCPVAEHCAARKLSRVEDLPRVTPKRSPTVVHRVAIVLASPSAVLLARRRPDALFGGLWEPPSTAGSLDGLAARLGVEVSALAPMGEIVHVLSHRRLVVRVVRGALGRRTRWPTPEEEYDAIEAVPAGRLSSAPAGRDGGSYAQAALGRKILAVANVVRSGLRFEIR